MTERSSGCSKIWKIILNYKRLFLYRVLGKRISSFSNPFPVLMYLLKGFLGFLMLCISFKFIFTEEVRLVPVG